MSFPKKYEKEMLHFDRSFLDSFASENDQKVPIIVYCTLKLNACFFIFFFSIFSKTDKINNNDINLQLNMLQSLNIWDVFLLVVCHKINVVLSLRYMNEKKQKKFVCYNK